MNRRGFIAAIALSPAIVPALPAASAERDGIELHSIAHPEIDYLGHRFDAATHDFCMACGCSLQEFVDRREPCRYELRTYGTAKSFDTEAELYQSITGQPGPARQDG